MEIWCWPPASEILIQNHSISHLRIIHISPFLISGVRINSWWASLMPARSILCLVSLMMEDGFITLFDTKKCSFYFIDIIPWQWSNLLIFNIVLGHAMRAWFPPMNGSIQSSWISLILTIVWIMKREHDSLLRIVLSCPFPKLSDGPDYHGFWVGFMILTIWADSCHGRI